MSANVRNVFRSAAMALCVAGCNWIVVDEPPGESAVDTADVGLPTSTAATAAATADTGPTEPTIVDLCLTDGECGDHELCLDVGGTGRDCVCAPGYDDALGACQWSGAIADPGFETLGVWEATLGFINPYAKEAAQVSPGTAVFDTAANCEYGSMRQTIEMPSYAVAEPLVLEVTHRASGSWDRVGPAVTLDDVFVPFATSFDGWLTERKCLGSAGYDATFELSVGPARTPTSSCYGYWNDTFLFVDHLEILPAEPGECPPPGVIPNGDAEGIGGWTFQTSKGNIGQITPGVGSQGSRGAEIRALTTCTSATMSVPVSPVHNDLQTRSALTLWFDQTGALDRTLLLDGLSLATLSPAEAQTNQTMCLPWHTAGLVSELSVSVSPFGLCEQPVDERVTLDDVAIVDDKRCPTLQEQLDAGMFDPGFESAPLRLPYVVNRAKVAEVVAVADSKEARTGNGVLALQAFSPCYTGTYTLRVTAPLAGKGEGPALQFWHRGDAERSRGSLSTPADYKALKTSTSWTQDYVCLDNHDRPQDVFIQIYSGSGSCTTDPGFNEVTYIDDLQLTTLAACAPLPKKK